MEVWLFMTDYLVVNKPRTRSKCLAISSLSDRSCRFLCRFLTRRNSHHTEHFLSGIIKISLLKLSVGMLYFTFHNLRQGGCGIGFFNVYILSNLLKKKKKSWTDLHWRFGPWPNLGVIHFWSRSKGGLFGSSLHHCEVGPFPIISSQMLIILM